MNVYQPSPIERHDPAWAWSPFEPDDQRPWNYALVGHLHRRAAFGATWEQMQQSLHAGPQATIDGFFAATPQRQQFEQTFAAYERSAVKDLGTWGAWWLRRLIESPDPLREVMTLFWTHHFAVSGRLLDDMQVLVTHVQRLRRQALGSLREQVTGLSDDAAVYVGLEATSHYRKQPGDHFVRPLIEHFTVGPDVCQEADIMAAARAWSGWFVYRDRLRFIEREKDPDPKTFLGQTGAWQREDILRILLEQRATAETVVRKLYRWLISETEEPEAGLLEPLVAGLARDEQIEPLVATMLRSNLFFSTVAYRQRVKSPVDYAVGLVKSLEGTVSTTLLAADVAGMGQRLGYPPTVLGWAGGRHWINTGTLTARYNLAEALLKGEDPYGDRLQVEKLVDRYAQNESEAAFLFLNRLLLQTEVESANMGDVADPHTLRGVAYALAVSPEYQLS